MMSGNLDIVPLFDQKQWDTRIKELEELKTTGVCFYSDGGLRSHFGKQRSGFGLHAYFFNDEKPQGIGDFKLDYPTAEGYKEKKLTDKSEAKNVVKFLNAYGNTGCVTSPVAELQGAVQAMYLFLDTGLAKFTDKFVLRTDSEYVVQGINTYLKSWEENQWRKSGGQTVKNILYWKLISKLMKRFESFNISVDIKHVYGHAFDTGNNFADQQATLGLMLDVPYGEQWVTREELLSKSVEFSPLFIEYKLLYYPSRIIQSKIDNKYYHYVYTNANSIDEICDVGRNLVDSSIGIIITDEEEPVMTGFYDSCVALDERLYPTPKVVDINVCSKPQIQHELSKANIVNLKREINKKDVEVITTQDKTAMVIMDPPRNAFVTLRNLDKLLSVYRRYLDGDPEIRSLDITDQLFSTSVNGKGVTKYKFILTESPALIAELPFYKPDGDVFIEVPLTLGLDLPRRRTLNNTKDSNPKVTAITWYENTHISYCATVVEIDGAVGVWSAEHSNPVPTEELKDEFYKQPN